MLKNYYLFRRPVILLLLVYAMGIVALKRVGLWNSTVSEPGEFVGSRVRLVGVVAAPPDPRPKACVYVIQMETVQALEPYSAPEAHSGAVLAYVSPGRSGFAEPGDRVQLIGRLQAKPQARIPGVFDYGEFLTTKGISALLYTSQRSALNLGDARGHPFQRWGWRAQEAAVAIFYRSLPAKEAAVLAGLVLGRRPRFDPDVRRIFVESGTMHILVASGSNIAFVVLLWFLFVRVLLRLPRLWALMSSLPAVWGYVLLVGADAPIVRAGVMTTVGLIGYAIAREDRAYHALALAALAILIPSPLTLFDLGFQMSFLTVFGMIYFLTPLQAHWSLRLAASTVTAQIWLFPITAAAFKRVFPLSLLSNLIVIPLAGGGLTAGLGLVLFDSIHTHIFSIAPIMEGLRTIIHVYVCLLIQVVTFFASFPRLAWWVSPPALWWSGAFYLVCFCVVGLRRSRGCQIGVAAGLLIMMAPLIRIKRAPPTTTFTWLDVGRQTVTLIHTPERKTILVSAREVTEDQKERVLMPFLMERRLPHITKTHLLPRETFIYRDKNVSALFFSKFPFRTQREMARKKQRVDVMVGHFAAWQRWQDEFVGRVKPKLLVETSFVAEWRPSVSPWNHLTPVVPQQKGWWQWSALAAKKPNH